MTTAAAFDRIAAAYDAQRDLVSRHADRLFRGVRVHAIDVSAEVEA